MEHIELEVLIQAPAQKVWDGLTNWQAQSQWMLGTKVWPVDGDGTSIGGKIEAFTGVWRIGFLDTMEITVWDPPRLCDVNRNPTRARASGLVNSNSNSNDNINRGFPPQNLLT